MILEQINNKEDTDMKELKQGYFTGERTIAFTINPMPLYANDFTVNYDTYLTYTDEPLNPVRSVVWKLTGETLVEGVDYTVSYPNSVKCGLYVAEIAFSGKYGDLGYFEYSVNPLKNTVSSKVLHSMESFPISARSVVAMFMKRALWRLQRQEVPGLSVTLLPTTSKSVSG